MYPAKNHTACALFLALTVAAVVILAPAGCGGGGGETENGEATVVEAAFNFAFEGDSSDFLSLVAPSLVEEARREMPEITDEELGAVMMAGFLRDLPYTGMVDVRYMAELDGDRAVVHAWGTFHDERGEEVEISEMDALRIILVKEEGRWYLDLLDL